MATPLFTGKKLVYGVPDKIKPIKDVPSGRVLLRLRNDKPATLYVRTDDGIRKFIVLDNGETWGLMRQSRNVRWTETKPPISIVQSLLASST